MKRTLPQNNSLHKYCDDLAESLNDAGYDQVITIKLFKDGFELPWTMIAMKGLFRKIAKEMYEVESTADLNTVQMQEVYKVLDKAISMKTGVRCEWPSMESMRYEQEEIKNANARFEHKSYGN